MSKPWVLVSPASRGLGHAVTRHLLSRTRLPILATSRSDPDGLRASLLDGLPSSPQPPSSSDPSSRLHTTTLDVLSESRIEAASDHAARLFPLETHRLRLAVVCPGVLTPERSPRQIDHEKAAHMLQVNLLGPLLLMKWFGERFLLPRRKATAGDADAAREGGEEEEGMMVGLEPLPGLRDGEWTQPEENEASSSSPSAQLPRHSTFLTLAARVGSTTDNRLGGWYTYRASKAGVISAAKTFDLYLAQKQGEAAQAKAMAVSYHPGTIRTGLSREFWGSVPEEKLFSPEYAAARLVKVWTGLDLGSRGRCWDWKGEEVVP